MSKDPDVVVARLREKVLDELQKLTPRQRRTAADDLLRELRHEIDIIYANDITFGIDDDLDLYSAECRTEER